jgi:hypothetical protein
MPIVSVTNIYSIPTEYNNITKVNLKFTSLDYIAIEGNKKFKLNNSNKEFNYYDTVKVIHPDTDNQKINVIHLQFEDSNQLDSLLIVISKSEYKNLYYNQIFYSSVAVSNINKFSSNTDEFRINKNNLVNESLLLNNDTLINNVVNYFNSNIDNLGIAECGTNCKIFKNICDMYSLPCRLVNLQGGDIEIVGLGENIGYPLHVVCEVFSSKYQKWYVIDPTFGFRFKLSEYNDYLSAVEISNMQTFQRDNEIIQDSILLTKRTLVGKDYFKFYENVIFSDLELKNIFLKKLMSIFFGKFNYFLFLYSNNFPIIKNGLYYVFFKSFVYVFLLIVYFNAVFFVILGRLFSVKKPKRLQ